jgi:uncharacterized damage-inducible protein DinB
MVKSLIEQYRRWFDYECDSHRKVLASLDTVPADRLGSEPFRKATDLVGHIVAARRMWLYRFGAPVERPAEIFPTNVSRAGLPAELEAMERAWSDYLGRLDDTEIQRAFVYQTTEGDTYRSVVADVLTHLYGHSYYHRGQIASLVRQAGGEPAKTDFIFWSREPERRPG